MTLAFTASAVTHSSLEEETPSARPARDEIDHATLEGCRAGDPAALRRFVLCYQGLVFAFLSRTVGRGPHVEDLAQEVFLRAHRALPRFELRGARVSTWLLTIAVRLLQDERKRPRPTVVPLPEQLPAEDALCPEGLHRRNMMARAFERAAAELSEEQRMVFVLAHFHGLSMAEIAASTSVPENTVKTRLFRAHARLRQLLLPTWEAER